MSRYTFALCASLFLAPLAFAADPAPAPAAAECTCKKHGSTCEDGCCSACAKDGKAKAGATCECKGDHCKSCPACSKKKAK
jgi:hypothetical protein